MPDFQTLKTMVKRSIDQKLRLRNFDARNKRIETGALVTNRRGQRDVERGPGECYQWKAKGQCSRGDVSGTMRISGRGGWGPQGMSTTGGGGPTRVPNLRVCEQM